MGGPKDAVEIVDLTLRLSPETVAFPGDPAVTIARVAEHDAGGYEVTQICLGSHSGTHIDAPRHFFPDGAFLSDYSLESLIAEGVVLDVRDAPSGIVSRELLESRLEEWPVKPAEFVLLWASRARASGRAAGDSRDSCRNATLSRPAAALLLELKVSLVGTDGPGLDEEDGSYPIHRMLLAEGVLLAENLCCLERLGSARVQCVFLPLPIDNTDGAPVRAIAWRIDPGRSQGADMA